MCVVCYVCVFCSDCFWRRRQGQWNGVNGEGGRGGIIWFGSTMLTPKTQKAVLLCGCCGVVGSALPTHEATIAHHHQILPPLRPPPRESHPDPVPPPSIVAVVFDTQVRGRQTIAPPHFLFRTKKKKQTKTKGFASTPTTLEHDKKKNIERKGEKTQNSQTQ